MVLSRCCSSAHWWCAFWKRPFEGGLIRWGAELHDRFMLRILSGTTFPTCWPTCVGRPPLRRKWFAAQLEFRFPKIDRLPQRSRVELRRRSSLGTYSGGATSVRNGCSVDSPLSVSVKLSGSTRIPLRIVCNGASSTLPDWRRRKTAPVCGIALDRSPCYIQPFRCMRR